MKSKKATTKKNEYIKKIRPLVVKILKKNGIKRAGIFGSYSEGKHNKYSDIDILIKPTKDMGFGFAGIESQLAKALNKKVDLLSYGGINPHLKAKILKQEVRII